MPYQNIDASLSESDLQEIREHLQAITTKLPFLVALTVDERRKLYKMGDKSLAFVTNSVNAAQANPDMLPRSFDLEGFIKDTQLASQLVVILAQLQQLAETVDDTLLAVGSEAMTSSLAVYDYAKTAAKHTPGLKTVVDQLGERFKALGRKRSADSQNFETTALDSEAT